MTISPNTAVAIAYAHQEIARGEKLLTDVKQCLEERTKRWPDAELDLRDVFGRRHNSLQLGIPQGSNGHQICDLSYELAVPIIEAHIAAKRSELKALSLKARNEVDATEEAA